MLGSQALRPKCGTRDAAYVRAGCGRAQTLLKGRTGKRPAVWTFRICWQSMGQKWAVARYRKTRRSGDRDSFVGRFARGAQLSYLRLQTAGITGTNRPCQPVFSTAGRPSFAGRIIRRRTLPHFGGIFRVQVIQACHVPMLRCKSLGYSDRRSPAI